MSILGGDIESKATLDELVDRIDGVLKARVDQAEAAINTALSNALSQIKGELVPVLEAAGERLIASAIDRAHEALGSEVDNIMVQLNAIVDRFSLNVGIKPMRDIIPSKGNQ